MDCQALQDASPLWLSCTDPAISYRIFCVRLPANLFDIEVLDDQNIQLQQFAGSVEGTRIENLQPGTYKVNEIKKPDLPSLSQLTVDPEVKQQCVFRGFLMAEG